LLAAYQISKKSKEKYEKDKETAPNVFMPRKPHKNGLLIYLLGVFLGDTK
jgi:hypothetical protein